MNDSRETMMLSRGTLYNEYNIMNTMTPPPHKIIYDGCTGEERIGAYHHQKRV